MATNYQRGVRKEYKIINKAREMGFLAFRSAGSHSPVDCFVLSPAQKIILLIQCKPKSMSENAKLKILNELKKYEGDYKVFVKVE